MESNMKKVFQYMTTLLLLLVVGTSCEEGNDNWRIITDAQPGAYITGDATIYSATATSSQLVAAPLDGAPEGTNVIGIYTWLKSNGSFTILNVDEEGNEINYGKGDVVASTPAETVALAAGGTPFTVAEDGLYYVAMNKADNQLTIIPATFGIIGDATPLQWNGETAMQASYNETQATVEYTISDVTLDKKEMPCSNKIRANFTLDNLQAYVRSVSPYSSLYTLSLMSLYRVRAYFSTSSLLK